MKNTYVVIAVSITLGLVGCASKNTKDVSEIEANVNTASEGEFGRCMQALYAGGEKLAKAQKILNKAEKKGRVAGGRLSESDYEEALDASERAIRERQAAEEACVARIVRLEVQGSGH